MQIRIETSWAGSNPCLNTFYFCFCCFLKKRMDYMLYRGVSFVIRSGIGTEEDYK